MSLCKNRITDELPRLINLFWYNGRKTGHTYNSYNTSQNWLRNVVYCCNVRLWRHKLVCCTQTVRKMWIPWRKFGERGEGERRLKRFPAVEPGDLVLYSLSLILVSRSAQRPFSFTGYQSVHTFTFTYFEVLNQHTIYHHGISWILLTLNCVLYTILQPMVVVLRSSERNMVLTFRGRHLLSSVILLGRLLVFFFDLS